MPYIDRKKCYDGFFINQKNKPYAESKGKLDSGEKKQEPEGLVATQEPFAPSD